MGGHGEECRLSAPRFLDRDHERFIPDIGPHQTQHAMLPNVTPDAVCRVRAAASVR